MLKVLLIAIGFIATGLAAVGVIAVLLRLRRYPGDLGSEVLRREILADLARLLPGAGRRRSGAGARLRDSRERPDD